MDVNTRQEGRILKTLPVEIRGTDKNGRPFTEIVRTLDISLKGTRVEWKRFLKSLGSTVMVEHRGKNAEFRVTWEGKKGTAQESYVGLECLEPEKNIWEMPAGDQGASPQASSAEPQKPAIAPPFVPSWGGDERRKAPRYPCLGGLNLCEEGVDGRMNGMLIDVSLGGCYMETRTPLSVGTHVELALTAKDLEVRGRGEVRICHPGLGMGIAFRELNEPHQQRLDELIKRLKPKSSDGAKARDNHPAADAAQGAMADALQLLLELLHQKGVLTQGDFLQVLERVKTAPGMAAWLKENQGRKEVSS